MKEEYYQIGEVSKITGISKDTLHFYSRMGLLVPDKIDPGNGYRYYSRWNLWQLDIITTCRKLSIPLDKVKQILSLKDNEQITRLLMDYRQEAIRLSQYYRQVADDIQWYDEENQRIKSRKDNVSIEKKWLDNRIVVVGGLKRNEKSYHANLQEVVKDELRSAPTIRRRYGYVLDMDGIGSGDFIKRREYLMIENSDYKKVSTENLCTLPAGMYAVFVLHIQDERADFSPFLAWLEANGETAEALFAEELGLQLFDYLGDYYCEIRALLKSE